MLRTDHTLCSVFVHLWSCVTGSDMALVYLHHSGASWCNAEVEMAGDRAHDAQQLETKRLSISVPGAVYQELEAQAAVNNVSLAWIVRKALSEYLNRDIPLLRKEN